MGNFKLLRSMLNCSKVEGNSVLLESLERAFSPNNASLGAIEYQGLWHFLMHSKAHGKGSLESLLCIADNASFGLYEMETCDYAINVQTV